MALLAMVWLLTGACSPPPVAPRHDAYIWQRGWRAELKAAIRDSADAVGAWHVLAAEFDAQGGMTRIAVDAEALRESRRPLVMVVRIEGATATAQSIGQIVALLRSWQGAGHVIGVEIDHDAGVASLGGYAQYLKALRAAIDPAVPLSITALPDWLDSPQFEALLLPLDEVVLQLHAIPAAGQALFDAPHAIGWVRRMARLGKPFRLALPNYGSRVAHDAGGRLVGVASETPVALPDDNVKEVFSVPRPLAAFLRTLKDEAPRGLRGFVWFRLPVGGDSRIWSRATWHAVMRGEDLESRLTLEFRRPAGAPTPATLTLVNRGPHDAELPSRVVVSAVCRGAAKGGAYLVENAPDGNASTELFRRERALLRVGQELALAELACGEGVPAARIEQ